ncbi:MAG: heparan-alpha-glucosaminide N-acetyltransferase [Atopobiaceae bacterium]|nr:heparan-alpha-glucosaminide N-acetyltransferase [Atopobiaceae bacterium]
MGRVRVFDAVRGFSVLSMMAFHLCYDLRYLYGLPMAWFVSPFLDVWRASISWTFLFVAGCMCVLSRSNLRRGLVYGAFALLIFVATSVAAADVPISFGIIFCMSACTLAYALLERLRLAPRGPVAGLVLLALFVASLGVTRGFVGVGPLTFDLPASLYATDRLSWLGFPGPTFESGDYYPVLPYLLMYLSGASFNAWWKGRGYPERLRGPVCRPLEFVGRHALAFYVAHQPLILAALWLALRA